MSRNVRVDARYGAESFIDHERVLDNLFPALIAFWLQRINHFRCFIT
ncbi:hypothetical protein C942_02437 [Photobacterium marinum]|uniref:Uncharacterized protein n=1 Tax=Photobacterium marinum TaxID=1056511 RepID=L8JA37_9GAMM|nr:hypothetical protein C942_02437 [Photobacterium marinum]